MDRNATAHWFDPLFTTSAMRRVFSDHGRLQGILAFEAALARAEARAGVIPRSAATAIEARCRAELFDIESLSRAAALAGNSAIPIVTALTTFVGSTDTEAARYVHWGATSQDVMDTGLVLQLRDALDLIEADLVSLASALGALAQTHKQTLLVGRTWLQHAAPMTFGLKVAGWLDATIRHIERLRAMRPRVLAVQLGGAVGTLSALGDKGLEVIALLAADLRLTAPNLPWHANRDRLAEVATTLGLIVGTLGKMARDISLMAQTEVGELAEPHEPGRGRSTALPQKQNPVSCAAVLGAAHRVPALVSIMLAGMVQEHERGLGGWQAEWETLPEICTLAAGALAHSCHLAQGLVVSAGQMAANLDFTKGLVQAQAVAVVLGRQIGRPRAHELLERACQLAIQQDRHLRDVLADDPDVKTHLSAGELQNLFNIRHDIQCAGLLVDQVLAAAERVIKRRPDK